jgi:hypothetical protein
VFTRVSCAWRALSRLFLCRFSGKLLALFLFFGKAERTAFFSLICLSFFSSDRSLQFILVTDPKDEADDLSPNTGNAQQPDDFNRATKLIICSNVDAEVFALSTIFSFSYLVELNEATDAVPVKVLSETLPELVSGASVEAVAAEICADPCMVSVSSGPADTYAGDCTLSPNLQQSCSKYDGFIKVVHTTECRRNSVNDVVMGILEGAVDSEAFLESVNSRGLDATVVNVDMYQPSDFPPPVAGGQMAPTPSTSSIFSTSGGGLTTGGMIITAFGSLALLALLLAFCWIWVAWRRSVESYRQKMEDDGRSLGTTWSRNTDDNSFLKPDFYDLALKHSKLDVHKCQSALCTVCRPNLGVVNMVPVHRPGDAWNGPVQRVMSSDLSPEAYGFGGGDNDIDRFGFPIREIESLRGDESKMDNEYNDSALMHNTSAVSALSHNRSMASGAELFHDTDEGFNFVRIANPRESREWDSYAANAVTL